MNNALVSFFDVYFDLLNVRSTLDFCMTREIQNTVYEGRLNVIKSLNNEKVFLRQFIKGNEEVNKKFQELLDSLINDIYEEDARILTKGEENVRVDHTQHLRILEAVTPLTELMKEVLFRVYVDVKRNNMADQRMLDIMLLDDRMYRSQAFEVALAGLINSQSEFNKCMQESKGEPTPQSNFIMQNEIAKYNEILNSLRNNCHVVDNNSLDRFDLVLQVKDMLGGRRELRPNMDMNATLKDCMDKLHELRSQYAEQWNKLYGDLLAEAQGEIANAKAAKEPTANA